MLESYFRKFFSMKTFFQNKSSILKWEISKYKNVFCYSIFLESVNDDFQVFNQLTNYPDLMKQWTANSKVKNIGDKEQNMNVYKKKTFTIRFSIPSTLNPLLFIQHPPPFPSTLSLLTL